MQKQQRQEIRIDALSEPLSHYTDAVRWGDLLFVSGLAPLDSKGALVGGDDAAAQCRAVLDNMRLVLDSVSATFADVLRVTVYLTDVADRTRINPVRKEFFGGAKPASTLVEVSALAVPGM